VSPVALDGGRGDLRQAQIALDVRRGDAEGLRRTVDELLGAEATDRATRFLLISIRDSLRDSERTAADPEMAALLAEVEAALAAAPREGARGGR